MTTVFHLLVKSSSFLALIITIVAWPWSAYAVDIFRATVVDNNGFETVVDNITVTVPSGKYQRIPGKRGIYSLKIPFAAISAMEFLKAQECGEQQRKVVVILNNYSRMEICTGDEWMYFEGKTREGDFRMDYREVKEVIFMR